MNLRVNYDQLASTYNQRYTTGEVEGVAIVLQSLAEELDAKRILEVGCGTGHWLSILQSAAQVYGLDLSLGMLRQASLQKLRRLACGQAIQLPFPDQAFDLVFCVNAIHHFGQPRTFISEARRLLKPGGVLAVVGQDPHGRRDSWYGYRYFEGTYETDLNRFPSWETILEWMAATSFDRVEQRLAEQIMSLYIGRQVLDDPFLKKESCSQLALLTDEAYADGLDQLNAAIEKSEASGETLAFSNDLTLALLTGRVPVRQI
jgi:SAM-dependent methyltransferase